MNDHFTKITFWKRVLSLFVSFAVVFAGFPLIVQASSYDPPSQDMQDLFSLLDTTTRYYGFNPGVTNITFNLPSFYFGYLEFLIYTDADFSSILVNNVSANFVKSGSLYRIYVRDVHRTNLSLDFYADNGSFILFLSGQYSGNAWSSFSLPCEVESYVTHSLDPVLYNYTGSLLHIYTNDNDYLNTDFSLRFYIDNYSMYDYINLSFHLFVSSVTSIEVSCGEEIFIPFDCSIIENPSADVNNDDRFRYYVSLSIDLSDFNLYDSNLPINISVTGVLEDLSDSDYAYASIYGVYGYIKTSDINPLYFWFSKTYHGLNSWFDSLLTVLQNVYNGNIEPGKNFQQQVDQKDQQLEDMADVMESVEQPDLNSVNVSANSYVNGTVLAASMSGITSVFSEGLFFDMIVMSIMMATAGYVLFGKR